ncbi:ribbon-helix-helix protein, CopG family [Pelomonas sp. SE-A7]|uniref:ribbon-helix-helix protein, CopG family n=1 Tax=Pelomonas sp. SE-A7 TaxID=3054953 RepID=UPI00259CF7FF|nr:ribbon-helix-helix protein, CopG family [Pelomonas sp. SE-A7]MDM4766433.1 CopG family transcriptional regulator [Pelomonas sp. SE-A7]
MSTTTIRIDEALKARLALAAERAGKSAHSFIVDAIAETVEQAERADEFDQLAESRWARLLETGKSVSLADAERYLQGRARGEKPRKSQGRKLGG